MTRLSTALFGQRYPAFLRPVARGGPARYALPTSLGIAPVVTVASPTR